MVISQCVRDNNLLRPRTNAKSKQVLPVSLFGCSCSSSAKMPLLIACSMLKNIMTYTGGQCGSRVDLASAFVDREKAAAYGSKGIAWDTTHLPSQSLERKIEFSKSLTCIANFSTWLELADRCVSCQSRVRTTTIHYHHLQHPDES